MLHYFYVALSSNWYFQILHTYDFKIKVLKIEHSQVLYINEIF